MVTGCIAGSRRDRELVVLRAEAAVIRDVCPGKRADVKECGRRRDIGGSGRTTGVRLRRDCRADDHRHVGRQRNIHSGQVTRGDVRNEPGAGGGGGRKECDRTSVGRHIGDDGGPRVKCDRRRVSEDRGAATVIVVGSAAGRPGSRHDGRVYSWVRVRRDGDGNIDRLPAGVELEAGRDHTRPRSR